MKLTKSELDKINLATAKDAALDLFSRSRGKPITLDTPDGIHIEIGGKKEQKAMTDSQSPPTVVDALAFSESYQYLGNAKARFDTKSAVGYSNCKADCRNALMSALTTLTGKEEVREAAKELAKQGILGKREEEFLKIFGDLLATLHGLASKKGSHPPMTREQDDAELVLGITTSILTYITNRAIKQRG